MDIKQLKNHLFQNRDKIVEILEEMNFHHIRFHSGHDDSFLTCGNPDGNNQSAITIYLTPSLLTINYTRDISPDKNSSDFIDLIKFFKPDKNFFEVLKWLSERSGVDFYSEDLNKNIPKSLLLLETYRRLLKHEQLEDDEDKTHVKPIPEDILSYYHKSYSEMFYEDGIKYSTQRDFEIGYDPRSNMFTIPIRDEVGNLVGVKGRHFDRVVPEDKLKYVYIEPTARNKVLFGYNKTSKFIDESDHVFVTEAEKGTLQLWSYGYRNCIGIGGTKLGRTQIEKISRLNRRVVLVFDKDFTEDKILKLRKRFLDQIAFYAIIDKENVLGEKESPTDSKDKFFYLVKNHVYKVSGKDIE